MPSSRGNEHTPAASRPTSRPTPESLAAWHAARFGRRRPLVGALPVDPDVDIDTTRHILDTLDD